MIKSILDTVLYKFSTSFAYFKLYPGAEGTFKMKRLIISLIFIMISGAVYSQRHFFTQDYDKAYGYGTNFDYIFEGEYDVYYKENDTDTSRYISKQLATIIINDTFGYYSLIFNHDSTYEVYEFEYKRIDWVDNIMCMTSKDFIGTKIAVLGIDERDDYTYLYLVWTDKSLYDKMLYYIKTPTRRRLY